MRKKLLSVILLLGMVLSLIPCEVGNATRYGNAASYYYYLQLVNEQGHAIGTDLYYNFTEQHPNFLFYDRTSEYTKEQMEKNLGFSTKYDTDIDCGEQGIRIFDKDGNEIYNHVYYVRPVSINSQTGYSNASLKIENVTYSGGRDLDADVTLVYGENSEKEISLRPDRDYYLKFMALDKDEVVNQYEDGEELRVAVCFGSSVKSVADSSTYQDTSCAYNITDVNGKTIYDTGVKVKVKKLEITESDIEHEDSFDLEDTINRWGKYPRDETFDQTYGHSVLWNPSITVNGRELSKNVDYTVDIRTGKNVMKEGAKVNVEGIGAYSGSWSTTIKINPVDISHFSTLEFLETSGFPEEKPKIQFVWQNGNKILDLEENLDYTVEYTQDEEEPNKYIATIKGIDRFGGTIEQVIYEKENDLSECTYTIPETLTYSVGLSNQYPDLTKIIVKDPSGRKLENGIDYELMPDDIFSERYGWEGTHRSNAGKHKIVLCGIGDYKGYLEIDYEIKPCTDITVVTVGNTVDEMIEYVSARENLIDPEDNSHYDFELTRGQDYTVEKKETDVAYLIVVNGIGNYDFTKTFTVLKSTANNSTGTTNSTKTSSAKAQQTQSNNKKISVGKVKGVKVVKKGKTVKLKWKKTSNAKGYEVVSSKKKNGKYKRIGTTTKTNFTKKVGKKKMYYKVRAYRKNGKKKVYGKYSTIVRK